MHESALAKRILEAVLDRVADVDRVRRVRGWVAETEALSPQSLAFHFGAHARGTRAEGAELELRLVHVQARCQTCGDQYAPEHHVLLCPRCGSTDGEQLGQTGVCVQEVEVAADVPRHSR